jgi:purine-binding chemotaxis protein CheW
MQANMASPSGAQAAADQRAGKYLIFQLGAEEFGADVLKVREIIKIQEITAVPQTPEFVKGVINLRGKVIPVIDLRMKFGLPQQEYGDRTCVIVVRARAAGAEIPVGVVVDGVVEVLMISADDIEDTPDFGTGAVTPYLLGMARVKGRVRILLDMDQVLSRQELHGMKALLP